MERFNRAKNHIELAISNDRRSSKKGFYIVGFLWLHENHRNEAESIHQQL